MQLGQETVPDVLHSWVEVGTDRVKISEIAYPLLKGILVHSPGSEYPGGGNDAVIWVGGPGVTADEEPTGGIPLIPGATLFLAVTSADKLWAVSTDADQLLSWIGQ
jgi:hypothetical protein